ncbi:F-box protein 47 [Microdochium nivale]|nr:F-box protein 47 [Microdochium nivale]
MATIYNWLVRPEPAGYFGLVSDLTPVSASADGGVAKNKQKPVESDAKSEISLSISSIKTRDSSITAVHDSIKDENQCVCKPQDKQSREPSALEKLPTEIIDCVLDFCGNVEVACLSLTSQRLQAVTVLHGLPGKLVDPWEGAALSRLLEPSARGYSYCIHRRTLVAYTWQSGSDYLMSHHDCMAGPTIAESPHVPTAIFAISSCYKVPWCTAHLVSNYGRFGPSHGLSPFLLSHTHPQYPKLADSTTRVYEAWQARVTCEGQVILRCVRTWSNEAALLEEYFSSALKHQVMVCAHVTMNIRQDHLQCRAYRVGMLQYDLRRSCKQCGAECDIHVGHGKGDIEVEGRPQDKSNPTWIVEVTNYYNLGFCQAVDDDQWAVFSRGLDQKRPVPYGTVKALWKIARD